MIVAETPSPSSDSLEDSPTPAQDPVDEWAEALQGFDVLQSDLHYHQAQSVLQRLMQKLDLTPRERSGLAEELQNLQDLLHKLEAAVIHIAVFGLVGRGKSSLLNALVGQPIFATGPIHGVTRQADRVSWSVTQESTRGANSPDLIRVTIPGIDQCKIELIDTPGLDEVNGEARATLATRVVQQADLILFVIAGDITQVEFDALAQLQRANKPILVVLNKADQYTEADRQLIYQTLRDERLQGLISPDDVVMAAADPLETKGVRTADGRLIPKISRGKPQVDALKLKILGILHREGKSLVALNTMLYADNVSDEVLARKFQIRDRTATDTIWHAVLMKATVVALNPITFTDVLSGAAVDVVMIVMLSRVYGIPMTQGGAVRLLQSIALELGGLSLSELLVTAGLSSLKGLLGLAAPATGGLSLPPYLSVAITQAAIAGVSTYGIGQVTKTYLSNGATWGEDDPKTVIRHILESVDEQSILRRIKTELTTKLKLGNPPSPPDTSPPKPI